MKVLNTSYGSSKYFLCFVTTFLCMQNERDKKRMYAQNDTLIGRFYLYALPIVKVKRVEGRFLLSFLRCVLRVKDLKVCETCESR